MVMVMIFFLLGHYNRRVVQPEEKKKNMECIYIYEKNYTISMSKPHTDGTKQTLLE